MFQHIKTTNVEKLDEMRGVYKKTKSNNVLLFVKTFKLGREMALMAVQNDHPIYPLPPDLYMLVEMLNPIYNRLVVCPAV